MCLSAAYESDILETKDLKIFGEMERDSMHSIIKTGQKRVGKVKQRADGKVIVSARIKDDKPYTFHEITHE